MRQNQFVLLDRDGVINEDSDHFIKTPDEWVPIPGSLDAIALLNKHHYKVAVITNQSGLARGYYDLAMLEKIHAKMHKLTQQHGGKIHAVYFCPHGPDSQCECRKPAPGLLRQFSRDNNIALKNIPFIGDTIRDIQAGRAAGAYPILVKSGKGQKTLAENPDINIPIFENLYEAAQFIISR